ncbi:hypothetical protein LHJ74_08110 [Streptomyces sp. N2-109]|uniref:DUF4232 domain-containing protein n=1 Tax=Streptomyces gossypii TaxID=2883101 RepID=A0ABT2JPS9_9ACTN|nr:hypothetical protein [Streptomyces gossypii]MCT2589877.1 hypothetical protein [Streptomyces gossypii]
MSSRGEDPDRRGREREIPGSEGTGDSADRLGPETEPEPATGVNEAEGASSDAEAAEDTGDTKATEADASPEPESDPDPEPDPESKPEAEPSLLGEDELRRLLRDTVRDIKPSPATLDHLRKAVPARRAHRRQALIGAAAAVLLGGAAIPGLLQVDIVPGGGKPMHAASHSESQGPDEEPEEDSSRQSKDSPDREKPSKSKGDKKSEAESGEPTSGATRDPDPSSSGGTQAPSCGPDQLGAASANVGEADGQGRIHGSFRVENTSAATCTVEGEGVVGISAQGQARSAGIQVVNHTSGDSATSLLSDPGAAPAQLVLEPGAAYVVEFAWIPREGGGTTGCATSTTPPPPDDGGTAEGGDGSPSTGTGTSGEPVESGDGTPDTDTGGAGTGGGEPETSGGAGAGGSDGGSDAGGGGGGDGRADASVSVSHTPDVGDTAVAGTVLPGACAGTVYRTGVLAGS